MAIGDQSDIFGRLKAAMPIKAWFADSTPILDATLQGVAYVLAYVYQVYAYARQQTRIITATDGYLDLIAADFFGALLQRKSGQTDASFSATIRANLLTPKATRAGMAAVLKQLTGRAPIIFEPTNPADTGVYGALAGYGVAGGYGSQLMPMQSFVVAYRPVVTGPYNVAGYGSSVGAYSTPSSAEYLPAAQAYGALGDADIYAAINATRPAASQVWVRISN